MVYISVCGLLSILPHEIFKRIILLPVTLVDIPWPDGYARVDVPCTRVYVDLCCYTYPHLHTPAHTWTPCRLPEGHFHPSMHTHAHTYTDTLTDTHAFLHRQTIHATTLWLTRLITEEDLPPVTF